RSHCAGGHLRAGMSADRGGADLRHSPVAAENPPHRHDRALRIVMADEALQELGEHIARAKGVTGFNVAYGELNVASEAAQIEAVMKFLRDDKKCQFVNIIDVCGVDYPTREKRFDVVYHLLSPKKNLRVRVKVQTDEQ